MIGWIQYSREAVAAAEQALSSDQQGVRDEIGFLALHQAFADRFFPGTSVLHTRLRYVLFVPWLMQRCAGDPKRFAQDQLTLTAQLVAGERVAKATNPKLPAQGIIGGTLKGREPSQTAAMMYWSALSRWGVLQPRFDGSTPSRAQVLQRYRAMAAVPKLEHLDGEGADLEDLSPFVRLPREPAELLRPGRPMEFMLTTEERNFLRRQLQAVQRDDGNQSLLGRLAQQRIPTDGIDRAWGKPVRAAADSEDSRYLQLAKYTSALAGIGRAVYSALVESAKNSDTGATEHDFSGDLDRMRAEQEATALRLDVDTLKTAFPGQFPEKLLHVLKSTQHWLRAGKADCAELETIYQSAEVARKGQRARLGNTVGARQRRAEWNNTAQSRHPFAEQLHYRWGNVRRLLADLGTQ